MTKKFAVTKTYYVDELLKQHGHIVLRLPPYHCELNPIEQIWSITKHKLACDNVQQSTANIEQLVRKACSEITARLDEALHSCQACSRRNVEE